MRRDYRRFYLDRVEEVVAEGLLWNDGKVTLAWLAREPVADVGVPAMRYSALSTYASMADLELVHGDGTTLVWENPYAVDTRGEPIGPSDQSGAWSAWARGATDDTAVEEADTISMDAMEALGEAMEQTPWPPKPSDTLVESRTNHGAVVAVHLWRKGWRIVRRDA